MSGHKRRAGEQEEAGGLHRGGGGKRRCCSVAETQLGSRRARARAKGMYLSISKWTYSSRRFEGRQEMVLVS